MHIRSSVIWLQVFFNYHHNTLWECCTLWWKFVLFVHFREASSKRCFSCPAPLIIRTSDQTHTMTPTGRYSTMTSCYSYLTIPNIPQQKVVIKNYIKSWRTIKVDEITEEQAVDFLKILREFCGFCLAIHISTYFRFHD